jgi:hypothetical protein
MSAIEVMDHKMDAGMQRQSVNSIGLTAAVNVSSNYV